MKMGAFIAVKNEKRNIPEYLEPYFPAQTQLQHYLDYEKHAKQSRSIENTFICLKGFSSATPFFRSSTFNGTGLGGGFFFRWQGMGVAVDPGIGFMTLMHEHSIFIDDIDVVIVTHAHIDHNADVRGLASLLYEYNKGRERWIKLYSALLPDETSLEIHSIHWILDSTTYSQVKDDIKDQKVTLLKRACDTREHIKLSDYISIEPFYTEHVVDDMFGKDSYGIKCKFQNETGEYLWGYTSDTKYFTELVSFLSDCNVLIMNISDIYEKDVEGIKSKSNHLGFDGCIKLINGMNTSLALISEFTCMNGDYRFEIVKGLKNQVSRGDVRVLPAEVGLCISLTGDSMKCSTCGRFHPISDNIAIHPRESFSKIQYICSDCTI